MLLLPLKPAVSYNLGEVLGSWLDSDMEVSFHQNIANPLQFVLPKPNFRSTDCCYEIQRLQSVRTSITNLLVKRMSHKSALHDKCLDDCYEYHAILLEFEKRGFPTINDEMIPIYIPWREAFTTDDRNPNKSEVHPSLVWERAVIMYNIVALLTQKIIDCNVTTDRDACKEAVGYCQQGASILSILKELVQSSSQDEYRTVDLSIPMLTFWEKLLSAEAQYNIYRMVHLGNSTDNKLLATLVQSGHELYNEALQATQDPRLQSELPETIITNWGTYCKTISMLLACKSYYHQSVVHRLSHDYGIEIAYLRECLSRFTTLQKFIKSLSSSNDTIIEYEKREIKFLVPIIQDRFNEADQDNYKIYQYTIPATVPDIVGKQLAKITTSLPDYMIQPKVNLFINV